MLLLLAGTGEAREISNWLAAEKIPAVASLAGATREPPALSVPTRSGGFGGGKRFEAYLRENRISAILDATHPFAARISQRTARLARAHGLPYMQVLRAPWCAEAGDRWTEIATEEAAAEHIPVGCTVFLATGRQTLPRFSNLAGRRLICRQIDPPERPFPFANGEYMVGRPPFTVADEMALFERLGIDWLVVKNAGGAAAHSKLVAARNLQIPVAMIARPAPPDGAFVQTAAQAMDWVRGLT